MIKAKQTTETSTVSQKLKNENKKYCKGFPPAEIRPKAFKTIRLIRRERNFFGRPKHIRLVLMKKGVKAYAMPGVFVIEDGKVLELAYSAEEHHIKQLLEAVEQLDLIIYGTDFTLKGETLNDKVFLRMASLTAARLEKYVYKNATQKDLGRAWRFLSNIDIEEKKIPILRKILYNEVNIIYAFRKGVSNE